MSRTVFSPIIRSSKLRIQQLFDVYRCRIRNFELLMMDRKTIDDGDNRLLSYVQTHLPDHITSHPRSR